MNKIKIPEIIREFSENEMNLIRNIPFRKKTVGKMSKKSFYYLRMFVNIIEHNKKNRKGFVQISTKFLGKVFKSDAMADNIIKCAKNGIIECNEHYNADGGVSKGYKLSEKFRYCDGLETIRKNLRIKLAKVREERTNENILTNEDLNKIEDLLEEVNNLPNDNIPNETETDSGEGNFERVYREIKRRNHFPRNLNRYKELGRNPYQNIACNCCNRELPSYMYTLNRQNVIEDTCKVCEELQEISNINFARNFSINRNKRRILVCGG